MRAFSSQLTDAADIPDLNNATSQIINWHYNDLVHAIAILDPKIADKMAGLLSTHAHTKSEHIHNMCITHCPKYLVV